MSSAAERAGALVSDMLAAGTRDAAEILAAAEGAKIARRTVQRAAIALGVEKTKAGFGAGWSWRLPADDVGSVNPPTEKQALSLLGNVGYQARAEHAKPVKGREVSEPSRAKVIATRLRHLEEIRGKKAPIYPQDSRVRCWVAAGITYPDLREAYERALSDIQGNGPVTAGYLDGYVTEMLTEQAIA